MTTRSIPATYSNQLSSTEVQLNTQPSHIRLVNTSTQRIVFCVRTALKKATTTPTGALDPNESAILTIKSHGAPANDRLTILWNNLPDGAEKRYRSEYFMEEELVRRKNLPNRFATIVAVLASTEKP